MTASTISLMGASDMTYVLEVNHFGVSVVLYRDVVKQDIHNPERFLCFTFKPIGCIRYDEGKVAKFVSRSSHLIGLS